VDKTARLGVFVWYSNNIFTLHYVSM